MASARLQVVSAHDQRCSSDADANDARVVPTGRRPDRLVDLVPMTEHQRYREHAARVVEVRSSRSEEHTSELQSLMRISYAVFCLKKKQITKVILLKTTLHRVQKIEI